MDVNKLKEESSLDAVPAKVEEKPSLINHFLKSFTQTDLKPIKTNSSLLNIFLNTF